MLHYPQIDPVIFKIGSFSVHWYALFYVISFVLGYVFLKKLYRYKKVNISADQYEKLLFWIMLGVIIGGRLGYALFYNPGYYLSHPLEIILPFSNQDGNFTYTGIAGMSFHGGALGVIIAVLIFCYRQKLNFWKIADPAMPMVATGLGLGRIGNFINGELYGRITASPLGMLFPNAQKVVLNSAPAEAVIKKLNLSSTQLALDIDQSGYLVNLPRHPSQLYEAFFEGFLMLLILGWMLRRNYKPGTIFWAFIGLYGIFRFIVEFFRQPDVHLGYFFGWITMGQILCSAMILASILGIIWFNRPAKS